MSENANIFDLGEGFHTTEKHINRVFGKFIVDGKYDVENIITLCTAKQWTRWLNFWSKVKNGEVIIEQ